MDNKCGASRIGIAATLAVLTIGVSTLASADTLLINDQLQVRQSDVARPARGATMTAVEAKFGAPSNKHDAVGTPPITRWDYPQFAVFFEKDRVIDAVLPPQASEPSVSPPPAPASSTPVGAGAAPSESQEPVAPTPASAPLPSDAPSPGAAPNAPAATAPADSAAPSSAAPAAPVAPAAPSLPAAQTSAPAPSPASSTDPIGVVPVSIGPSTSTPAPSPTSSEDPIGAVPVSGPSASTPAPSSSPPVAPTDPHP